MPVTIIRVWLLGLMFAVAGGTASADPQSQSFSTWKLVDDHITMRFTVASREVTRLAAIDPQSDLPKLLVNHLQSVVGITADSTPCESLAVPQIKASKPGYLIAELRFRCPPDATALTLHNQAFFDLSASHVHFAKFALDSDKNFEQLFTSRQRSRKLNLSGEQDDETQFESNRATVFAYIVLGFEHILEGLDHIAFLLCLIILSGRLKDIIFIVTGFTIGHSITLSLAVLGYAKANIGVVEAVIGFTIALVAVENIAARSGSNKRIAIDVGLLLCVLALFGGLTHSGPPWLSVVGLALFSFCYLQLSDSEATARKFRPLITGLFGLVHGFGFANVLLEVGIPSSRAVPALFGFNVGVELGQIAIVLAMWLCGLLFFTLFRNWDKRLSTDIVSALLCSVGVFWFVQRAYFL
ncbi:MAG: HupE/UreJ family protein [Pseudomonadales bacterium]